MKLWGSTFTTVLAAAMASLVVASCGGDDKKTKSTSTAAASSTTTPSTAAPDSREEAVRQVTRDFITALAAGEQGTAEQRRAACDSLSIIANDQLLAVGRKLGASDCPQTLARIGTAAGPDQYAKARSTPIDVAITGDVATASYAAPLDGELTTIKLRPIGETWIIQELPTSGSASGSSGGAATTTAPTEADAPSGDLGPVAAYIPQDVLKYCKAITGADLPEGVTAALNCKPFTDTEINYGIVKDRATLDRLYGNAKDGGPPRAAEGAVAGTACQEPGRHEGRFTNQTFGIQNGRVRCWTLSTGKPRFQWYVDGSPDAPIFIMEATESDKVWGSLYRVWAENAGPDLGLKGE